MNLLKYISFTTLFFIGNISFSQEKIQFDGSEWKRQQNKHEFAKIFTGQADEAIKNMAEFITKNGADAEVYFGLSVAWYSKNKNKTGLAYFNKAIESGLPIERFMAGPKKTLKALYSTTAFKILVADKELIHGPLLGSMNDRSVAVWIRTFNEVSFTIDLSKDAFMGSISSSFTGKTLSENDFTGIARLKGLKPSTKYYYTIRINDKSVTDILTFNTFPEKGSSKTIRFAFGGGAAYNPDFEQIWDVIGFQKPDAFFAMGDNVYIDKPKVPEAQKNTYYQRQSSPQFKSMTASVPLFSIWDDHDFGVNDSYGGAERFTPKWKTKVLEIFKENYANPTYGGGAGQPGTWYDFSMGNIDFFMLDARYYRTPSTDKSPNMLGKTQMDWLKNQLSKSNALFKVIVSSVPWSDGAKDTMEGRFDTWRGYQNERKEIFDYLTDNSIPGVFLLSADRHRHDAWKHQRENDYPLYEFTSSRLTNIHYHKIREKSLFGYNQKNGFGLIEFNMAPEQPYLVFKVINIDGELISQIRVYHHQLTKKGK